MPVTTIDGDLVNAAVEMPALCSSSRASVVRG
jgi:hypothetical protein